MGLETSIIPFSSTNKRQFCFEDILGLTLLKLCYHVGVSSYRLTFFNIYYAGPQITGTFGCGEHRTPGASHDHGGVWAWLSEHLPFESCGFPRGSGQGMVNKNFWCLSPLSEPLWYCADAVKDWFLSYLTCVKITSENNSDDKWKCNSNTYK